MYLIGDAVEMLGRLPSQSAHMCVTSPPYYGLRDYGCSGQIGMEQTPEDYVARMVEVFRAVRRVLRDDGTLWLNLGDSYNNRTRVRPSSHQPGISGIIDTPWREQSAAGGVRMSTAHGYKEKDLLGIPWMVAFALRADGWYLRSDIVWHKPNSMPESVADRPTKAHEYLFLLAKSERYYYDAGAIREPFADARQGRDGGKRGRVRNVGGRTDGYTRPGGIDPSANGGRNRRSVWSIPTKPYAGAHFAVFPESLVEPCIMAGTSGHGACSDCGAGWVRVVERLGLGGEAKIQDAPRPAADERGVSPSSLLRTNGRTYQQSRMNGWRPGCGCGNPDVIPCTVLDPFFGSGTVGAVANRLGRSWVGIELNPEYEPLIIERTSTPAQMALTVA